MNLIIRLATPRSNDSRRVAPALLSCALSVLLATGSAQFTARAESGQQHRFDLSLKEGNLVGAPAVIRVSRGDTVALRWTVDRPVIVHLHGYDLEVRIGPEAPRELVFEANATGRFPIETHAAGDRGPSGRHKTLLYLEVHPR